MRVVAESYAGHRKPPALLPPVDAADLGRGASAVQLWNTNGTTLLASSWPALTLPLQRQAGFDDVRTSPGDDASWRVYAEPGAPVAPENRLRVQVVQSDDFRRHRIIRRALFEGLSVALLLPLVMLMLWVIVTAASRALRAVARDVVAQDERSFSELSAARVPEEITPLVDAFNGLLARLRAAFATQRRFVQDAAHELRSPIAAITLQIEALRPHVARDGDDGFKGPARLFVNAPASELRCVFDRFFRVPGAAAGGSGPGLSIAQAATARRGMRIALRHRTVEEGVPGAIARVYSPLPVPLPVPVPVPVSASQFRLTECGSFAAVAASVQTRKWDGGGIAPAALRPRERRARARDAVRPLAM